MKRRKKMPLLTKGVKICKALDNPHRENILVLCAGRLPGEKPYNISELQEKIGVNSYKNVYNHVKTLKSAGLVKTKKHLDASGRAVTVEATKKGFLLKVFLDYREDFKYLIKWYDPSIKEDIAKYLSKENDPNKIFVSAKELSDKDLLKEVPLGMFLMCFSDEFEVYFARNGKRKEDKNAD